MITKIEIIVHISCQGITHLTIGSISGNVQFDAVTAKTQTVLYDQDILESHMWRNRGYMPRFVYLFCLLLPTHQS